MRRASYNNHIDYLASITEQLNIFRFHRKTAMSISEEEYNALSSGEGYNLPDYMIHEPFDLSGASDKEIGAIKKAMQWAVELSEGEHSKRWLLMIGNSDFKNRAAAIIAQALDENWEISFNGGMKWIDCFGGFDDRHSISRACYRSSAGKKFYRETSGIVLDRINQAHIDIEGLRRMEKLLNRMRHDQERAVVLTMSETFNEFRKGIRDCDMEKVDACEYLDRREFAQSIPDLIQKHSNAIVF